MKSLRAAFSLCLLLSVVWSSSVWAGPLLNPRSMAEWEELRGVIVVWYEEHYVWMLDWAEEHGWTPPMRAEYVNLMLSQSAVINAVLAESVYAYVPDDTSNYYDVAETLSTLGVTSPNLVIFPYDGGIEIPGVWVRDRGPFNVYENAVGTLHAVGWAANWDSEMYASWLGLPYEWAGYGGPPFYDGGNFMTDGHGRLFCDDFRGTTGTYENVFRDLFGLNEFIDLPPYQVHIDYYMKLINEEVLLVSHIPFANYIGIEPSYDDSAKIALAIDKVQQTAVAWTGRPYKVVRIRNAPSYDDYHMNLTYLTTDASYVNSLIVNRTVIVPTFECPETDSVALRIYEECMQGYTIVGVPCVYFAQMSGVVHCITKEIGADAPVLIFHAWYPDSLNQVTDYGVWATIRAAAGISGATLCWTTDPDAGYEEVPMTNTGGDWFGGTIPGQPYGTRVHYYIEAASNAGKVVRRPLTSPEGAYAFFVDPGGETSDIPGVPGPSVPVGVVYLAPNHPNPFRSTTLISFSTPSRRHVNVLVYDVAGRVVAELLNGIVEAGTHSLSWDGRLTSGSRASPGVYILGLESAGYRTSRKMLLIR